MKIDIETGELVIHQVDIDHIIGWFVCGDNLQEAIERELILHGLDEEWNFDANKIVFDDIDLHLIKDTNTIVDTVKNQFQRYL